MSLQLFGYLAAFVSLVGIILNAKKNIWCWVIWLFSNAMWITYSAIEGDVPSIVLWTLFSIVNVYGWVQWIKDKKPLTNVGHESITRPLTKLQEFERDNSRTRRTKYNKEHPSRHG